MCGIFGLIEGDRGLVRNYVRMGTDALAHRGPDDAGNEIVPFGADWLGLGHRRLSILDLSASGHQPMVHAPTGCRIIFNGEIYNFRRLRTELERDGDQFRSGSDTEVLLTGLARHGTAYLHRLEGMYAFAFYDPRSSNMLLARDPAGIKPLYFAKTSQGIVFASEVRAILATGLVTRTLDRRGVAGYLAYGAVPHPLTLFEGVSSLSPGCWMSVHVESNGRRSVTQGRFWSFPSLKTGQSSEAAVAAVRETVSAAVRDHLVADVPAGVFLSSGIDSTILAGLAAEHARNLRSFTVVFEDEPDFSEQRIAADSANRFGLDHTEIPLPASAAESAVGDWLAAVDQPSIDGLNVFVISRAVREQGVKVALSGLGADEQFGGYPSFRESPRLWRTARWTRSIPPPLRRQLANAATIGRSSAVRLKLHDMLDSAGNLRSSCLRRRRVLSEAQLARLGLRANDLALDRDYMDTEALSDVDSDERDAIRIVSQVESRSYQGNTLLRDADMNGMAFGLEIRVPFLDQRVMNLVHAIPGAIRLPAGRPGKYLLRNAFTDLLRPEILNQPKKGFTLPIRRWMTTSLKSMCEQSLDSLAATGVVCPDGVNAVWDAFLREPESPMWSRAFALVVLGEFCRRNGATA